MIRMIASFILLKDQNRMLYVSGCKVFFFGDVTFYRVAKGQLCSHLQASCNLCSVWDCFRGNLICPSATCKWAGNTGLRGSNPLSIRGIGGILPPIVYAKCEVDCIALIVHNANLIFRLSL
jgi:hypothetical protein